MPRISIALARGAGLLAVVALVAVALASVAPADEKDALVRFVAKVKADPDASGRWELAPKKGRCFLEIVAPAPVTEAAAPAAATATATPGAPAPPTGTAAPAASTATASPAWSKASGTIILKADGRTLDALNTMSVHVLCQFVAATRNPQNPLQTIPANYMQVLAVVGGPFVPPPPPERPRVQWHDGKLHALGKETGTLDDVALFTGPTRLSWLFERGAAADLRKGATIFVEGELERAVVPNVLRARRVVILGPRVPAAELDLVLGKQS